MWSITTFAFSQAEIYIDMNGAGNGISNITVKVSSDFSDISI